MSDFVVRALERIHGHVAWFGAAALMHPAVLLRRPKRHAPWAALASTSIATLAAAIGFLLYPAYREQVKPVLFSVAPRLGLAFERKEHLGVAVVVLAWIGLAAHWTDCRERRADTAFSKTALVAYTGAAFLALLTACLGTAVAIQRDF